MNKKTRNILITIFSIGFGFIFVLYLSILLVFPKYFNSDYFCGQISKEFKKNTGLELNIENLKLKPAISPFVNIQAHHVVIRETSSKELLKIRDIELRLKVLPLITKTIAADKITIYRPVISLNISNDGTTNLDKYIFKNYPSSQKAGIFTISEIIPKTEIKQYKIKFYDKRYKYPFIFEGNTLNTGKTTFKNDINISTEGLLLYNKEKLIGYNIETELPLKLNEKQKKLFNTNPFEYLKKYQIKANFNSKVKVINNDKNYKLNGFANIKDLKFVVDGKTMSDNHLNLIFKDNKTGIDADIKSNNISLIKISGETVNGGIRPRLKLFVKSKEADIKTLKETAEAILNSFNIKNDLNLYNINGKTDLDFIIESNYKTLKSSGVAKISNANIQHKEFPYKITDINSVVNFEQNHIKIEPSKMYINSTPITIQGSIANDTKMDIVAEGKNLDTERLSKLFLPSEITNSRKFIGIIDFKAQIQGTMKVPKIKILSELNNFKYIEKNKTIIKFAKGKTEISVTKENPVFGATLTKANILPDIFANELTAENLTLSADTNSVTIPETRLLNNDKPLILSGKIEDIQKLPKYKFDINGNVKSESLLNILKEQKTAKNLNAAAKGYLTVNGQIIGKNNDGTFKGTISADKDNYLSFIVIRELLNKPSSVSIDLIYGDNNVAINNISLQNKSNSETVISVKGKIQDFIKPKTERLIVNIPKAMTVSSSQLKDSEVTLKSNLELNGYLEKPSIKGTLEVKNLNIPDYRLSSSVNEIIFTPDSVKINLPKVIIGNTQLSVKAETQPELNNKPNLKFITIESEYLDLDELNEALEPTMNDPVYPGIALPFNAAEGTAKIKTFKTAGHTAENITCDIKIENNNIKINNINGTAYKGTVSGKAEYNTLMTKTYCDLIGKNADIRSLMAAVTGVDDNRTGRADYKIKLNTIGTKLNQQQRTAKGYAEFTARNGVMGPLCQFEHFLYAQNLISQSILKTTAAAVSKVIKPKNTGVYTVANGIMEIEAGTADFKDLTFEGPNMSLYIQGKMNLPNNRVDLQIYGRISEDIEKFLGDIKNPMPKTILSTSSETSLGNIFYDEYNTKVSREIMAKIPPLNPDTGLSARPFAVKIQGAPENIKSVKSFKWITGTHAENENQNRNRNVENKEQSQNIMNTDVNQDNKIERNNNLPDFINNLPDDTY